MEVSVIVPTYNEKDNIKPLVQRIARAFQDRGYEIVLVDDNSPDGTGDLALALANRYPIRVIRREGARGLGSAILEGFRNAKGDMIGVIDADLQHPPEVLAELATALENGADVAIASRHVAGGGVENWSAGRKTVSKGAILLARPLTNIRDPMSGCFMLTPRVIEGVNFSATGYKLLLEILVKGKYHCIKEVPYIFKDRQVGKSKLGAMEYVKYLRLLFRLYLNRLRKPLVGSGGHFRDKKAIAHTSLPSNLAWNRPPETHTSRSDKLSVSIGVCAYNEEANIGKLLRSLQRQRTDKIQIVQIVVVSSACLDGTDDIVQSFSRTDQRIELIKQAERKGKSSAVNLFLQVARGKICVLVSADTIVPDQTIEHLCRPFFDEAVGMTGGHPVPINDPATFMGFASHLIWRLAHEVSLIEPKLGELIAFRNIIHSIPQQSAVDEASIEAEIKEKGYQLRYVPEAIIYNKGPERIPDYIKQRRRIYAGHLYLKGSTGHQVSSMNSLRLLRLVIRSIEPNLRSVFWTPAAVMLESWSRILGSYDFYIAKRNPYIWEIASSTKVLRQHD